MSNVDLEQVVEDSVNDSVVVDADTSIDTPLEADASTSDDVVIDDTPSSIEVKRGVIEEAGESEEQDEFARKFGLSSQSVTGRENRIPYSRVKKIVARAEQEAIAKATKDLEGKFTPQTTELSTKVKDYEDRLTKVAQFENILENDPKTFLTMLSKVPAYKEFFDQISQGSQQQPQKPAADPSMPQPDQTLSDGTTVYSMEGLQNLLAWQAKNVEDRVSKQVSEDVRQRYAPIEQEWHSQQQRAKVIPVINAQLADARTWPQFNENEDAILQALRADRNISLEGAYRQVVYPKLQTSRDDMRKSILEELKRKPVSSSAPLTASRPGQPVQTGKRDLLDVVREAAQTLK